MTVQASTSTVVEAAPGIPDRLRRLWVRYASDDLARQIGATALSQGTPQLLIFLASVWLAAHTDDATYGVWTVTLSILALLSVVDGGLGPAICWRISVHVGARRRDSVPALLTTALVLAVALGAGITVALTMGGHAVVRALGLHTVHGQAETALSWIGLLVAMTVLGNVITEYLRAVGGYAWLGVSAIVGAAVFTLCAVAVHSSRTPVDATLAVIAAQAAAALIVAVVGAARGGARLGAPLVRGRERMALWRYARHTQVAAVTALIALQLDGLVIAALFGARAVGQYGVAATMALAFRTPAFYVLAPIRTKLALAFGADGLAATLREAARIDRSWRQGFLCYTGVCALVCLAVLLALSSGSSLSLLAFLLLLGGYGANLTIGVRAGALAASGHASILARNGLLSVATNLVCTLPLAWAFGPSGVVLATFFGQILGVLHIRRSYRRLAAGVSLKELVP